MLEALRICLQELMVLPFKYNIKLSCFPPKWQKDFVLSPMVSGTPEAVGWQAGFRAVPGIDGS